MLFLHCSDCVQQFRNCGFDFEIVAAGGAEEQISGDFSGGFDLVVGEFEDLSS